MAYHLDRVQGKIVEHNVAQNLANVMDALMLAGFLAQHDKRIGDYAVYRVYSPDGFVREVAPENFDLA